MTLKLYFHPLSSFCHKVLIALYENGTPFEPQDRQFLRGGLRRRIQGDLAGRQDPGPARREGRPHHA